eukprot:752260-Hanusia_phi.AAC.2
MRAERTTEERRGRREQRRKSLYQPIPHKSSKVSGGSRYLRARKRLRPFSLRSIMSPGTNLPGSSE